LIGAVALAVDIKEYERGHRHAEEALAVYRDLGDAWGIARATFFQGFVAIESGDFARARPFFEESLQGFVELDSGHDVQIVLFNLSWACDELGDQERARQLAEECLRRARASGSAWNVAFALDLLETYAREDGRLVDARDAALECLRIRRDEGDVQHQLDGLSRMAAIDARADRMETAVRLLSSSLHLHEELGMKVPLFQEKRNAETLALMQGGLDEQAVDAAWDEGRAMSLEEAVEYALASIDRPRGELLLE
jgi:tetratricopeptide (TPR) repeat protein